ncbi:potassium channel family protein [[Mycoplasma] anseris]|uniref:TrkA family potassium uptake protein n=1 Tax=[Mycoplasma] anseris TaxID=92400 RepID=A0A2Z4NDR5_9BACT|nr:TrkA family potassium uptake protein [[Mycoplasma] anseris]AWX69658.1 TrkA family potassium uptake protein [[Mycoplasma] anseris]
MRLFKKTRNICIIGLGRFGTAVAEQLLGDRSNNIRLVLIDINEKNLIKFKDQVDSIYVADSADKHALEAVNIDAFDAVIVSTSDNIEIVAALAEAGVKKIIARANSKRHANVLKQIGVHLIISPEDEAGKKTALLVANQSFAKYSQSINEIQEGYVTGSLFVLNPKIVNKKIKDLGFRNKYEVSLILIKRGNESFLPEGDFEIKQNDLITIIGKVENVTKVFDICGKE